MRGFNIYIPPDCSCSRNSEEHKQAPAQLEATAGAKLNSSASLKLPNLIHAAQISQRASAVSTAGKMPPQRK
jgi:hypothetical protein